MVGWENRWHFAMPPTISPQYDVWETSAEIPYWWHVTTQIWVLLLIGCATCQICFNQSGALPHWIVMHQYGISVLVSQTSFRGETVGGVAKCRLFSQATVMAENLVILLWPFSMGETNPWQGVCHFYSIICKLKRSSWVWLYPGPCLWSCMSGLNELSKTFCIFLFYFVFNYNYTDSFSTWKWASTIPVPSWWNPVADIFLFVAQRLGILR